MVEGRRKPKNILGADYPILDGIGDLNKGGVWGGATIVYGVKMCKDAVFH